MEIKTKLKPKKGLRIVLYILGTILALVVGAFLFYLYLRKDLTDLGYSVKASDEILFSMKKTYVEEIGENKTLNAAFESKYYKEKYLDNYSKIKYQPQKHLIKNINALLKKGYNNNEVSMILSHGTDEDVEEFTKHDKVEYLEEFLTYDFAKIKNYDRYLNYMNATGEDEENTIIQVNIDLDKEPYQDPVVTDDYSCKVLVTKHRKLKDGYKPKDLITIPKEYVKGEEKVKGDRTAWQNLKQMIDDAKKEGMEILVNSAYRSFEDQTDIYNEYLGLYGEEYVRKYVSTPGFSEHQTGLGFDLASAKAQIFQTSKEYEWVVANSSKYGFVHRYPSSSEEITGFSNESWHFRYVGKKIATYVYEHRLVYDEYYAMFLDKD